MASPFPAQEPTPEALQKLARESLDKVPALIEASKGPDEGARNDANARLKLVATLLLTDLNRPGTTDAQVNATFRQIATIGAPALGPLDTYIETCKKLAETTLDRFGADADPVVRRLDDLRHRAELERTTLVARVAPDRAQQEYLEAMNRQYMAIAENHGRTSVPFGQIALELGDAYFRLKRYDEAESCLNPAREAFAAQSGEASVPEIACLFRLAIISRSRKQFDHARILARRWMERVEKTRGTDHPSTAVAQAEFGDLEFDAGEFRAAADHYRRSVEILRGAREAPTEYLPGVLTSYAATLEKLDQLDDAAQAYREALTARRRIHGESSREAAAALHLLGLCERTRKDYPQAESHLSEALRIRLDLLGPDDIDTSRSQAALGRVYLMTRQPEKAEPLLRAALATRESKLGPDHPDTRAARGYLDDLKPSDRGPDDRR